MWSPRGRDHTTLPTLLTGAPTTVGPVSTTGLITGTRAIIAIGGAVPDIGTMVRGMPMGRGAVLLAGIMGLAAPQDGAGALARGTTAQGMLAGIAAARRPGGAARAAQRGGGAAAQIGEVDQVPSMAPPVAREAGTADKLAQSAQQD
jgi:hypothetical protein